MKRDTTVPVLTAVLVVLCLPSAGLLDVPWLPQTPTGAYTLALVWLALASLLVPPERGWRGLRPLVWLLAATPVLLYGILGGAWQRPGGWLPVVAWFAVLLASWAFGWFRRPAVASAALLLVLGASAVLGRAGLPGAPGPILEPLPEATARVSTAGDRTTPVGIRRGAPVRLPEGEPHPLVAAGQTVWVPATSERHPGPRPVVLVLDGAKRVGTRWRTEGVTVVGAGERALDHAFALLAFDAVVVRSNAWRDDDPDAATKARALADYVRKGGLLIGPATSRPWPAALGRALHAAARGQVRGPDGVLTLGLGRVTRAETQDDVREILAADLWVPEVGTKLAGPLPPAPMPSDRFRWHDDPKERRTLGYLLLLHAAAVALLTWLVRRRDLQIGALLLAAGAIGMGLVWITPRAVHLRVEGLVTELGGPGGRRHEAVVLSAGPEGYVGQVTWRRGGVIQRLGGAVDEAGRLRILPGRTVWLIREDPAGPGRTPDAEDRAAGWLRPLLVGAVDPRRLRFGRGAPLPIQIEGLGPIPASSVAWRRP